MVCGHMCYACLEWWVGHSRVELTEAEWLQEAFGETSPDSTITRGTR